MALSKKSVQSIRDCLETATESQPIYINARSDFYNFILKIVLSNARV